MSDFPTIFAEKLLEKKWVPICRNISQASEEKIALAGNSLNVNGPIPATDAMQLLFKEKCRKGLNLNVFAKSCK